MNKDIKPTTAESLLELHFSLSSHLTKQLLNGSVLISFLNLYEKLSLALIIQSNVFLYASHKESTPSGLANYFHVSLKDHWLYLFGNGQ